jgi:hypothetical protein
MPTWFLDPIAGLKLPTLATNPGGINSKESIPGLLKSFKKPSLVCVCRDCTFYSISLLMLILFFLGRLLQTRMSEKQEMLSLLHIQKRIE